MVTPWHVLWDHAATACQFQVHIFSSSFMPKWCFMDSLQSCIRLSNFDFCKPEPPASCGFCFLFMEFSLSASSTYLSSLPAQL